MGTRTLAAGGNADAMRKGEDNDPIVKRTDDDDEEYDDDDHDDDHDDTDDSVLTMTGSGGRPFRSLAEGCLPSRKVSGGRPFRSLAEGCIT